MKHVSNACASTLHCFSQGTTPVQIVVLALCFGVDVTSTFDTASGGEQEKPGRLCRFDGRRMPRDRRINVSPLKKKEHEDERESQQVSVHVCEEGGDPLTA